MLNRRFYLFAFIVAITLTTAIGLVSSVAANQIPTSWEPYLWLVWPIWLVLFVGIILISIWQYLLSGDRSSLPGIEDIDTEILPEIEDIETEILPLQPPATIPSAPARLKPHGFFFDPFVYSTAEEIPSDLLDEILQEIYVENQAFERHLEEKPNRSLIVLDPRGSGKTFARLRLEIHLRGLQNSQSSTTDKKDNFAFLVVPHTEFNSRLREQLPNINLQDHSQWLLVAVGKALCDFIVVHPVRFLRADTSVKKWAWTFLDRHLGTSLKDKLQQEQAARELLRDWEQNRAALKASTGANGDLENTLMHLAGRVKHLGLDGIVILLDNLDGYPETQPVENLEALISPILNTSSLLSNPDINWKIFLPNSLRTLVENSFGYKTDRIDLITISWDEERLQDLLSLRLKWASEESTQRITQLFDERDLPAGVNIDREMARIALRHEYLGPPRFLLKLGSELLDKLKQDSATFLTYDDWLSVKRANRAVLLPMIVILHARQNARWSTKLGDDLVAHLGQAWLDRQEIDPANLTEQLRYLITEVDEDDALLLIISEHSVSLCQNEEDLKAYVYLLHELQRKGAHVLLLQQAACIVPPALANGFELIDFQSNYRQGIRNVVERIYVSNERNRTQGIPGVLRSKIEDTLLRCASFENDRTLKALFVDSRLIQWQGQLPEATSAEERVKLITDFLFNRRDSQGQNGLGLILDVLAETHPPNDACRQQLFELASEIYDLTRR